MEDISLLLFIFIVMKICVFYAILELYIYKTHNMMMIIGIACVLFIAIKFIKIYKQYKTR